MRWNLKFSVMVDGRSYLYNLQVVHVKGCCLSLLVVPGREILKKSQFFKFVLFFNYYFLKNFIYVNQAIPRNELFSSSVLRCTLFDFVRVRSSKDGKCWKTKLCYVINLHMFMCRKGKNDLFVTFGRVIAINILILGLDRAALLSNALYCH